MKKTAEVSKLVGVSKRTLQYYDDQEMIYVKRTKNNHRLYDEESLQTVWRILLYKEMGFDLQEIKTLLLLDDKEQREALKQKIQRTDEEIEKLRQQNRFIALIVENGIPEKPEEKEGVTYLEKITALKTGSEGLKDIQDDFK